MIIILKENTTPQELNNLTLFNLASSIIEDILNGNIPDGLSLAQLTEGLPDSWQEQCKKLGFSFRQMKI